MDMITHPGLIIGFGIVVTIMLLLDLGVFNKHTHVVSSKEAIGWSVTWISLSMIFSLVIYFVFKQDSPELALEKFSQFQSAYWIEKALSVDNLFVFILVFSFFKVRPESQHKVLFWGVLGAIIFRAIFIFAGVELINHTYLPDVIIFGKVLKINVVLFIFGIFLLYAGIKTAMNEEDDAADKDLTKNPGARFIYKNFKVSDTYDGDKFFTVQNGVKMATPLLVVVGVIEFTDLMFAVDSIPAVFAVSQDPFILYTSNIFAILGLRSLYFLLANFMHKFYLLKYALALILCFIGLKMVISPMYHLPSSVSLIIVGSLLVLSVLLSLMFPKKEAKIEQ